MTTTAPPHYVATPIARPLAAFLRGAEKPLRRIHESRPALRKLRSQVLNFVLGGGGGSSSSSSSEPRQLRVRGSGGDGSFQIGGEFDDPSSSLSGPSSSSSRNGVNTDVAGSWELLGTAVLPGDVDGDAAEGFSSPFATSPVAPDERAVTVSLRLAGFPSLSAFEEFARRLVSCASERAPHAATVGDREDACAAAVPRHLPCLNESACFDLDRFGLLETKKEDRAAAAGSGSVGGGISISHNNNKTNNNNNNNTTTTNLDTLTPPERMRFWLPFHARRCAARYPRLWQIVGKLRRLRLAVNDGAHGGGPDGFGASSPFGFLVLSPGGLLGRCLVHGRDVVIGDASELLRAGDGRAKKGKRRLGGGGGGGGGGAAQEAAGGVSGAGSGGSGSGGGRDDGTACLWAPRLVVEENGEGRQGRERYATVPFSLKEGFELPVTGAVEISVRAVLGLATLTLPTIRYAAIWKSGGGSSSSSSNVKNGAEVGDEAAADTGGRRGKWKRPASMGKKSAAAAAGAGASIDEDRGGRLEIRLTSIASLPSAVEWVLNLLVDLQRFKRLLLETFTAEMVIEPSGSGSGERGGEEAAPWQFRTTIRVRLAALVSPFFAGILKRFIGWTIPDQIRLLHDVAFTLSRDLAALSTDAADAEEQRGKQIDDRETNDEGKGGGAAAKPRRRRTSSSPGEQLPSFVDPSFVKAAALFLAVVFFAAASLSPLVSFLLKKHWSPAAAAHLLG